MALPYDPKIRETKKLLDFADCVRSVLIDFGHTDNFDLISKSELRKIYEEACQIVADICGE